MVAITVIQILGHVSFCLTMPYTHTVYYLYILYRGVKSSNQVEVKEWIASIEDRKQGVEGYERMYR